MEDDRDNDYVTSEFARSQLSTETSSVLAAAVARCNAHP